MKRIRADAAVRAFWERQTPNQRKVVAFFVMSARQAETRERRFALWFRYARQGKRIPLLAKDRT